MTDEIRKRERLNDALLKTIRTQQDHAAQGNDELRREIAEVKRRLGKLEQQAPSAPSDVIRKGADDESWPRRITPADIRRAYIFDPPARLQ